jgi:hypothetical protein
MSPTRIALVAGIVFLVAFVVIAVVAIHGLAAVAVIVILAMLIAGGNLLYGRHSHGAAAQARVRPAQDARDRAAAVAADARRAVADAERRGEQFCPLDPSARRTAAPEPSTGTRTDL